jgi:glycerophosphoryl diester phosphodiesterase
MVLHESHGIVLGVIAIIVIVLCALYGSLLLYAQYRKSKTREFDANRELPSICKAVKPPIHVSHCGGFVIGPSNTIYSFRKCIQEFGTDMLQLDLYLTSDDHIVIFQQNYPTQFGDVRNMTLHDLKELDAGYYFSPDNGVTFPLRGKGITFPTLEEILDEFIDDAHLMFFLQFNQREVVAPALEFIKERGLEDRVFLGADALNVNNQMLRIKSSKIPSTSDYISSIAVIVFYYLGLLPLLRIDHDIIRLKVTRSMHRFISDGLVKAIHNRNRWIAVCGPGLDYPNIQQRFIDLGVQLLITDRPDVLSVTMGRTESGEQKFI